MEPRVYYYEDDLLKIKASTSRYRFALKFLKDKSVVDIGCGARMGPYILAEYAVKVVGIDHSREAIFYDAKNWPRGNISYMVADALSLPVKSHTFDAVVSLEVIEHIDAYETYLGEVSRILKEAGIFVISTPNRYVASPEGTLSNPGHIREFDLGEFKSILGRYFPSINIYGQFPSQKIQQIEFYRRENYQRAAKTPAFFKRIIPAAWKEALLKTYLHFSVKFTRDLDDRNISDDDFVIIPENLEKAKYFLAVCRK